MSGAADDGARVEGDRRVHLLETRARALDERLDLVEALLRDLVLRLPTPGEGASASRGGQETTATAPRVHERYLVVRVARRLFGLPLEATREVVRMVALAPLPDASPAVEGLLDLRGEPLEVVDLRVALGGQPLEDDVDCRILILDAERRSFGLKVDEVLHLERVRGDAVDRAPELSRSPYLVGVTRTAGEDGEMVLLIDTARLFAALVEAGAEALALPAPELTAGEGPAPMKDAEDGDVGDVGDAGGDDGDLNDRDLEGRGT